MIPMFWGIMMKTIQLFDLFLTAFVMLIGFLKFVNENLPKWYTLNVLAGGALNNLTMILEFILSVFFSSLTTLSSLYKERHYVWYSFEWIPLNTQILGFICLVVLYTIYGLNKVEIMSDRSWMGGNRAFVWYAIESRPGYEYAFVWKPIPEPEPSELMLMRTLQREMWEAALKRNTWFQAH